MTLASASEILKKVYGYDRFRGEQEAVIAHVAAGGHAFVLMPTGGGKSLCYQIPAMLREGVGIVVSPLIALMLDQVEALRQQGVQAAAINSSMQGFEVSQVKRALREGALDLLYVAPERLLMPDFLELLEGVKIALFAIDEAHCVSQWGHDFRPHYMQLAEIAQRFPAVPRIALTATADVATRKDIVEKLGLAGGVISIAPFDRPNIHYRITVKDQPKQQLLRFVQSHAGESGIIYGITRDSVEELANWLCEQGINALPYHAGLDAEVKTRHYERFMREEAVVMVATVAFGMGINKPDVRFVAHLSIPKNIEAYYQETGRAGRDGLPSEALMLYGLSDSAAQRRRVEASGAPEMQKRIEHQKLNALLGLCEAARCRRQVLLEYFGDTCAPCQNCDTCLEPRETFDGSIVAQKALSAVAKTGQRMGVGHLTDVLTGKDTARMQELGHASLSVFGIGKEYGKGEWQGVFRQLVAMNLLFVTEHGGLQITEQGMAFLRAKPELRLSHEALRKKAAASRKDPIMLENAADAALLSALKAVRTVLAKEQNIPPYIIFHDKTLREMAQRKPMSMQEMLSVSGVGEQKMRATAKPS